MLSKLAMFQSETDYRFKFQQRQTEATATSLRIDGTTGQQILETPAGGFIRVKSLSSYSIREGSFTQVVFNGGLIFGDNR